MKIRSLICLFAFLFTLPLLAQLPRWQVQSGPAPLWLQNLGNGRDGTYLDNNPSGDTLTGVYYLSSFTVPAGFTVNSWHLTVHSLGPCVINGTIRASGVSGSGYGGGSGGGGGGGSNIGVPGGNSATSLVSGGYILGGFGGTVSTGAGAAGIAAFDPNGAPTFSDISSGPVRAFRDYIAGGWGTDGSVIAGALGGQGGNSGGYGGGGGGSVILICGSISGLGVIDASGGPGCTLQSSNPPAGCTVGANNTGAGGGGGGGAIILSSPQSITFSGTLNVAGGAGGTCGSFTGCGPGGVGGAGWIYAIANWQP